MSAATDISLPPVRGRLTAKAPLAPLTWFKVGGAADWLFEPADTDDLADFLRALPAQVPVMALGLGSNLIVRDGGVAGVVVHLRKAFAATRVLAGERLHCGGGASGIRVAAAARDAGIAGLEFLRGIPGTVGGFVRMNGGAYGSEVADILLECEVVARSGERMTMPAAALHYRYRHSALAPDWVVVSALFQGRPGAPAEIAARMEEIAAAREESQPLRTRTGGSTFQNPPGHKAWALVDAAGCRGLRVGGAEVSVKHANFLINRGDATAADIEALGEEVRRRVRAHAGVQLDWEIRRVGRPAAGGAACG